jgi:hypothetical protein
MGWSLSLALLVVSYVLIDRAVRQSVQSRAMLPEDNPDKNQ